MIDYNQETYTLTNPLSGTSIELYPTYKVNLKNSNKNSYQRTIGSQLNNYRSTKDTLNVTLPLTWVSSSDKAFIDDLWYNQTTVLFTQNNSTSPQNTYCLITNTTEPLNIRSGQDYTKFSGNLFLKSVSGTQAILFFTLDDSVLGLLDQNYNPLS